MKKTTFATVLLLCCAWPAAAQDGGLLDQAKSQQSSNIAGSQDASARADQLAARTQELTGVMGQVVSRLEDKGVLFERVQGDNQWNPLPEIGSKTALERRRKPPRVIIKPKADERIYAEMKWDCPQEAGCQSMAVMLSNGRADVKLPVKKGAGLAAMQRQIKEAVLKLIAAKKP